MKNDKKIFYLLSFFGGVFFNLSAPFLVVYMLSIDISIFQIGMMLAATKLTIFICEIPTGAFADLYGRKRSVLMTYGLTIISSLIIFLTINFYWLLAASILAGLAITFITGAFESLAIDSLGLADRDKKRDSFFLKMSMYTTLGFIVGGVGGSLLSLLSLRFIWLIQAGISGLAWLVSSLYIKEDELIYKKIDKNVFDWREWWGQITSTLRIIMTNKKIYGFIVIISFTILSAALFSIAWPVYFEAVLKMPVFYLGIIASVGGVFYMLGAWMTEKFEMQSWKLVMVLMLCIAVLYFVFALSKNVILIVIVYLLIDFLKGGSDPLLYSILNKFLPSSSRATILSYFSMFSGAVSGVGEFGGGILMTSFSSIITIMMSPLILILSVMMFYFSNQNLSSSG